MKFNSGDSVRPPRGEPIVTGFAAERLTTHDANRTSWNEDTDLDATMPPPRRGKLVWTLTLENDHQSGVVQ